MAMSTKLETISTDYAVDLLKIYAFTEKRIATLCDWLRKCVEKRIRKGQPVTTEHLANSSTVKNIGFECKKIVETYDKLAVRNDARQVFQFELAEMIIDDAKRIIARRVKE